MVAFSWRLMSFRSGFRTLCRGAGKNRRGVFAAATFVFLPGLAGAERAAGNKAGFCRFGSGLFCKTLWRRFFGFELELASLEILLQEGIHCHGLPDGDFGWMQ